MWAIWLIEPIGGLRPSRAAMTPAMKVEATAPIPGVSTPRRPVAGAICRAVMEDDDKDNQCRDLNVEQFRRTELFCTVRCPTRLAVLPDLTMRQLEYLVAVADHDHVGRRRRPTSV